MSRLAIRLLAFGLLGLLTTIVVCWVLSLRTDWRTGPRRNFGTGLFMLEFPAPAQNTTWTFFPITQWGVLQISAGNSGPDVPGNDSGYPPAERMAEDHEVPTWSVMRRGDPRGVFDAVYLEQGFGFPMLAMAQQFRWTSAATPDVDGLPVPKGFRSLGPGEWVPTRFIPAGVAIDSAVYGWLWFAVLMFPGIVLRSVRHWRRVCLGCGYDLRHARHDRCPECGLKC